MSKIGIIYCAYGMPEYIAESLSPWLEAKKNNLGGDSFIISAVSVQFLEYKGQEKDFESSKILSKFLLNKEIDYLTLAPEYITEVCARNLALQSLLDEKCETIILVDVDEFFSTKNIFDILNFASLDKFQSWFSFSYKNYVFSENKYLEEPFTPPRLFRVKTNGYTIKELYHDNDFLYEGPFVYAGKIENRVVSYRELPSKNIPKNIAWIKHKTWLSNEKSRLKIEYQKSRWGQLGCSYDWDYKNNKLIFNNNFYIKNGQSIPKILEE